MLHTISLVGIKTKLSFVTSSREAPVVVQGEQNSLVETDKQAELREHLN